MLSQKVVGSLRVSVARAPFMAGVRHKSDNAGEASYSEQPLYLNPHAWQGLPADRIFELHELRKTALGKKYVPNDDERRAILSTVTELGAKTKPELEYVYALDHFKERHMNNTPVNLRGLPPQKTGIQVIKQGETPHQQRKIDILNTVSAYEMPLLAKFRQEYKPVSNKEAPITLRFSDDFSEESSSFNRKVTLSCNLADLELNEQQQRKFKILSGQRFNHETNEIKIASDAYPEATQNARWLAETFEKLLTHAKDLTDDLADVPIDTRHTQAQASYRKKAQKHEFPEAWKRPQDAPASKFQIVQKLVEKVKDQKDKEYMKSFTP
ncbi:37S ribosomal protein S24, mitochondrial [[Candida] anglica]|uniref:Small ribosomal subunit protein mS35 n=1 Tax=[Candida] anglica TaxID=148631 RepID=A0ABP0EP11_9ASCO